LKEPLEKIKINILFARFVIEMKVTGKLQRHFRHSFLEMSRNFERELYLITGERVLLNMLVNLSSTIARKIIMNLSGRADFKTLLLIFWQSNFDLNLHKPCRITG